jgi:hypothetical protein
MRYKIEPVTNPDEDTTVADGQFTAVVACPRCGRRWKSSGALAANEQGVQELVGARRVEMLAQFRNGCPACSSGGGALRDRQHGRLRSAWPGSRR